MLSWFSYFVAMHSWNVRRRLKSTKKSLKPLILEVQGCSRSSMVLFLRLSAAVVRHKANDGVYSVCDPSTISTMPHCTFGEVSARTAHSLTHFSSEVSSTDVSSCMLHLLLSPPSSSFILHIKDKTLRIQKTAAWVSVKYPIDDGAMHS